MIDYLIAHMGEVNAVWLVLCGGLCSFAALCWAVFLVIFLVSCDHYEVARGEKTITVFGAIEDSDESYMYMLRQPLRVIRNIVIIYFGAYLLMGAYLMAAMAFKEGLK